MLGLKLSTDPRWVNIVESNIDEILTENSPPNLVPSWSRRLLGSLSSFLSRLVLSRLLGKLVLTNEILILTLSLLSSSTLSD